MAGNRAANRYAKALIGLANEQNQLDAVYADMKGISAAVSDNKELRLLLNSPIVKSETKQVILDKIFSKSSTDLTNKFVATLTSKKREELLGTITTEFIALYKANKGIIVAEVTTAVQLDSATKEKVLKLVKAHSEGTEIELTERVNPNIIGGFVVRIEDKMIDGSVAKTLNDLRKELLGSGSHNIKLN